MSRGVFLLAFGHPHYVKLSCNLAMGIKMHAPDLPIVLFCDSFARSGLEISWSKFFDRVEMVGEDFYTIDGKKHWGYMKTKMYELAPFDENLYIDCDSLVNPYKNFSEIFELIDCLDFYVEIYGGIVELIPKNKDLALGHWAKVSEVLGAFPYKSTVCPGSLQSSVIYFRKTDEVQSLFKAAESVFHYFSERGLQSWYSSVPDELCFSVAMSIVGFNFAESRGILGYAGTAPLRDTGSIIANNHLVTFPSASFDISQSSRQFYEAVSTSLAQRCRMVRPATHWKHKAGLWKVNRGRVKRHV